jgi:hydrogenase maturation protease
MTKPRVLVLGIGNILLSDEGVGVHVINRFQEIFDLPDSVEIIDGGTMGLDLMPYFEGKSHVFVVDAVCADGEKPGTIQRFSGSDVTTMLGERISPHQIGLSDLLACTAVDTQLPDPIVLLGIVPESLDTSLDMTPTIQARVDTLVRMLQAELEAAGIALESKHALC